MILVAPDFVTAVAAGLRGALEALLVDALAVAFDFLEVAKILFPYPFGTEVYSLDILF